MPIQMSSWRATPDRIHCVCPENSDKRIESADEMLLHLSEIF